MPRFRPLASADQDFLWDVLHVALWDPPPAPLLRAALEAASAHGYAQVSLTVHPANPAIALYERCGFRHAGLRRSYHWMVARL